MTDQDRIAELHRLAIEVRRNMSPAEIDAAAQWANNRMADMAATDRILRELEPAQ